MTHRYILLKRKKRIGVMTLNRPDALNALNLGMMIEVVAAAKELDHDPAMGAI